MGRIEEARGDDGVVIVRFVNPPTGLLDNAMTAALEPIIERLSDDVAVRAIILTGGDEGVFIRHFDIPELERLAEAVQAQPPAGNIEWDISPFHRMTCRLETAPKPVIAAINGHCMGVGYELALSCDIRIASDGSYGIGLPELNIGTCPGGGGTVRLARLLGAGRALEMLLAAQTFMPAEAARLGLVDHLAVDALSEALVLARRIVRQPADAVAATKRVVRQSLLLPIEEALTLEQRAVNKLLPSDEALAAMRRMIGEGLDIRNL